MKSEDPKLAAFVLARIEWELDRISERQHELARRREQLRERATLLRLGAPPAEVDLPMSAAPTPAPWAFPNRIRQALS